MSNFTVIGEPKEGRLSWKIRKLATEQFIDPLFIFKEAINNTVENALEHNIFPKMDISFKNKELIFKDKGSGINIDDFMHYGESSKKEMIGRYGHGFKDTALKIGKCIYIGCKYGNWKIFEKKDDWPVLYQPIEEDLGVKEGTWFIVPLKDTVTFEYEHEKIKYTGEKAILEYIKEFAALALHWDNIEIFINEKRLKHRFLKAKEIQIKFDNKRKASGLLLRSGSGIFIYSQGGYFLDSMPFDTRGSLLLNIDCLAKEDKLITPTKKISFSHPTFKKIIEPQLIKWMKKQGIWYADIQEAMESKWLSQLLKPFISGQRSISEKYIKPEKPRVYMKTGKHKGKLAGGIQIIEINRPDDPIYFNVTPEHLIKNIGHPMHGLIKKMNINRRMLIQTIICADRAVYLTHKEYNDLTERRNDWKEIDTDLIRSLRMLKGGKPPM